MNIMAVAAAVPSDLYDRFLFNTREQVDGEPIHVFAQSLQNLVNNCHYVGATDSHLSSLVSVFVLYLFKPTTTRLNHGRYCSGLPCGMKTNVV